MAKTAKGDTVGQAPPRRERLAQTLGEQRRQAVAEAIEAAAMGLFSVRPMPEVKVEEIADHAGVAVRTVYRYFPTKEDIFSGLPRRGAQRVAAAMMDRPARESPFQALRHAFTEVAGDVELAELELWLTAVVKSSATDRIGRMALAVSTEAVAQALAERADLPVEHLWTQMAATMAGSALTVGTRQWALHGGSMLEHQLAALDIAGKGLSRVAKDPRPPVPPTR